MEKNKNEWNVSNLVWEQHGGNGMTILLLDSYFKIKD